MRLSDLSPRWFTFANPAPGTKVFIGLTFLCPHCQQRRLGLQFYPPIDPAGLLAGNPMPRHEKAWTREAGETFETLTLRPSICVMEFENHWHGFIENGEIR